MWVTKELERALFELCNTVRNKLGSLTLRSKTTSSFNLRGPVTGFIFWTRMSSQSSRLRSAAMSSSFVLDIRVPPEIRLTGMTTANIECLGLKSINIVKWTNKPIWVLLDMLSCFFNHCPHISFIPLRLLGRKLIVTDFCSHPFFKPSNRSAKTPPNPAPKRHRKRCFAKDFTIDLCEMGFPLRTSTNPQRNKGLYSFDMFWLERKWMEKVLHRPLETFPSNC